MKKAVELKLTKGAKLRVDSTVTEMMQLSFLYHKLLLLALFINPAWWLVQGVRKMGNPKAES